MTIKNIRSGSVSWLTACVQVEGIIIGPTDKAMAFPGSPVMAFESDRNWKYSQGPYTDPKNYRLLMKVLMQLFQNPLPSIVVSNLFCKKYLKQLNKEYYILHSIP